MDPKHVAARRDIQGRSVGFATEMGLLALVVASGMAGVYYESATLAACIFLGGLALWLASSAPDMLRASQAYLAQHRQAQVLKQRKRQAASRGIADPEATLALIKSRRSVFPKDFSGRKVPRDLVEQLLEAANWAPTHNLSQPWRFVVLEGDSKVCFEQLTIDAVGKYTQPAEKAEAAVERMRGKASKTWPLVSHYIVLCCARPPVKGGKPNPEWEDLCSLACAVQNLALQAHALGIAGYWSSWQEVARSAPEVRAFLQLEPDAQCYGVFSLGYSDRAEGYRGSRSPIMSKVTWLS